MYEQKIFIFERGDKFLVMFGFEVIPGLLYATKGDTVEIIGKRDHGYEYYLKDNKHNRLYHEISELSIHNLSIIK